ncbi:MAG: hypothetical protein Q9218_001911 [Villophora microphyllina]
MTDPFTVAASTAGFLSLGLEVCKGLTKYYSAWKSYGAEIENILAKLNDLSLTLTNLSDILSVIESLDESTSEILVRARQKIRSCTATMNKLYQASLNFEPITQPAGVLDQVHNVRLRSMHLFQKEYVASLLSAAINTQRDLDSAVQLLHLHLTVEQRREFRTMVARIEDQSSQGPSTVEQAILDQLGANGQCLAMLRTEVRSASKKHDQAVQKTVRPSSASNVRDCEHYTQNVQYTCRTIHSAMTIRGGNIRCTR